MTRAPQLERIRNLGIIAHVDAGKTTLTERVLYFTGRIHRTGEVHDGTTHTDHHPLERARGITILAAAVTCDWQGHRLHLIDTPGHVDFTVEVERSLRVLDGAVVVLDGVAGVEPQTETVWRQADRHRVPRLVFVNKLDRPGADFSRAVAELGTRLGARAVVIAAPVVEAGALTGTIDLIDQTELRWDTADGATYEARPATLSDNLLQLRARLLDACADEDPSLIDAILDGTITPAQIRATLRRATVGARVVPVLCGSAKQNLGVQPLLDAVVALLPSPIDRGAVHGVDGASAREPDRGAPTCALGFKVVFDEHGQMTFVRVYAGALVKGAQVVLSRSGRRVRIGRLVQLHADQREEVDRLEAGEIGAVMGLPVTTGETLADPAHPIALEAIAMPEPVVRVAIEPVGRDDRDRLSLALQRMTLADPSLRLESDPDTDQFLLAGMGQLHLDITVERLKTEHTVHVTAGRPRVAYRTTLSGAARQELHHVKQSGGPGQVAHVTIEVGPAPRGAGLVFEDRIRGGVVPRPFIKAVEAGVRQAMADGVVGGHPVVDVQVALVDGATHPKDSNELAFFIAGSLAFKAAAAVAGVALLEPIMRLEVVCDDGDVGAVVGDLGRRRAQVLGLDVRGDQRVIRAEVPLAESFGYAGALSGLTHGRGRFAMEPGRYEEVPARALAKAG